MVAAVLGASLLEAAIIALKTRETEALAAPAFSMVRSAAVAFALDDTNELAAIIPAPTALTNASAVVAYSVTTTVISTLRLFIALFSFKARIAETFPKLAYPVITAVTCEFLLTRLASVTRETNTFSFPTLSSIQAFTPTFVRFGLYRTIP